MQAIVAQEEQDGVYVSVERFAEVSGLTPWVIRKWINDGIIPALRARGYLINKEVGLEALRKHIDQ